MSKSNKDFRSRIELTDTPEVIKEKVKKAVTDAQPSISYDSKTRPGISNLVDILNPCVNKLPEEIVEDFFLQGLNKSAYKDVVSDALIETLRPFREKYQELVNDKAYLNKIISESTLKANEISAENYEQIRRLVGFEF